MPTGNVTYIQNNYYGNSAYTSGSYNYSSYGYGCNCGCSTPRSNYNYRVSCFGYGCQPRPHHPKPHHARLHHCSYDRDIPTSLKWAIGLGVGTAVVGSIIKACGK